MPAGRAIDVPIEVLPPIDEHSVHTDASAEEIWEALFPVLRGSFGGRGAARAARALGCAQVAVEGDLEHPGGTLPGFIVARSVPPVLLALLGAHRYARYALIFRIDRLSAGGCQLRAETRAVFDGTSGRFYRALVIGTRAHVLVVRRLLRAIQRRAEA